MFLRTHGGGEAPVPRFEGDLHPKYAKRVYDVTIRYEDTNGKGGFISSLVLMPPLIFAAPTA